MHFNANAISSWQFSAHKKSKHFINNSSLKWLDVAFTGGALGGSVKTTSNTALTATYSLEQQFDGGKQVVACKFVFTIPHIFIRQGQVSCSHR